jgi:hypothetical protein
LSADASHIFICFSSKDEAVALEVVRFLEADGLNCWISSRDVPPGQNYQETIVQALESARAIVFLFSDSSSKSGEIKKELSLGGSFKVPVFPLRLSPVMPSGALRYELATRQWIDLFAGQEQALRRLAATIKSNAPEDEHSVPVRDRDAAHGIATTAALPKQRTRLAREPIIAADGEDFEAIRVLLARHVGPIAKVLIQKAVAEAQTAAELCERLAAHVTAPSDRAVFLKAVRAQLSIKS